MIQAIKLESWALTKRGTILGFREGSIKLIETALITDFKNGVFTTATESRYILKDANVDYERLFPDALWRVWNNFNQHFNQGKCYYPEASDPDYDYKALWWLQWIHHLPHSDRRRQLAMGEKTDWQIYHPTAQVWTAGGACDAIDALTVWGWPIRLGEMEQGGVNLCQAKSLLSYYQQ